MGMTGRVDNRYEKNEAEAQKKALRIKCRDIDQNIEELSGGNQQKVILGKWMAAHSKVIIFDEPTAMLDPLGRKEVMATVREMNRDFGITVIHITHYMEEAVQADRIVVIDKGEIVMDDTPVNVFSRVEDIKRIGLDVPQVTEVAYLLKQAGVDIDTHILTIDEMVKKLCQLKQNI